MDTPRGRRRLTPAEYMRLVAAVRPDAAVVMCDEVDCNTGVNKRERNAVDRSLHYLEECLAAGSGGVPLLGVVAGAGDAGMRARAVAGLRGKDLAGACAGLVDVWGALNVV